MRARASGPRGTSGSDEKRSCTECLPAAAASKAENCASVEASAASGMLLTRPTNMAPSRRGEGLALGDAADICFLLGQSCSSTAMTYAMHQVKIGCITRHMGRSRALERILTALCAEQLLLASSTTEGQGGGNIRSSEAPVEHHDGGRISLERRAS